MKCDRPGIVYSDGVDGMLRLGCSACNQDFVLGEVALLREIVAAEQQHHSREPGVAYLGYGDE